MQPSERPEPEAPSRRALLLPPPSAGGADAPRLEAPESSIMRPVHRSRCSRYSIHDPTGHALVAKSWLRQTQAVPHGSQNNARNMTTNRKQACPPQISIYAHTHTHVHIHMNTCIHTNVGIDTVDVCACLRTCTSHVSGHTGEEMRMIRDEQPVVGFPQEQRQQKA